MNLLQLRYQGVVLDSDHRESRARRESYPLACGGRERCQKRFVVTLEVDGQGPLVRSHLVLAIEPHGPQGACNTRAPCGIPVVDFRDYPEHTRRAPG